MTERLRQADRERELARPGRRRLGRRPRPRRDPQNLEVPQLLRGLGLHVPRGARREKLNHHRTGHSYDVVDVTLTTHACDGLSRLDLDLARRLDKLAGAAEVQRDHSEPVECLCKLHHGREG